METARKHTTSDDDPMVIVFSSSNHDAEMESLALKSVLESAGIGAVVVGPTVLPSLEFQVQVPQHLAEDAKQIIVSLSKR